jgi:methylmalonyl-CoA mutase cobalamin-binding domain/chain
VTSPSGTQAVDRAARLLTEVVHSSGSVTFTELAATTGLAKSTTSRLLLALERNGLVQRDDHGRFRPGEVFVSFAWRGCAEAGLAELAQPFLQRLGEQTGETVNLGVERDGMIEQIAQVDSVYVIGVGNWLGRPVPLHCTALGKILLAYGAATLPAGRLEHPTERTITSRTELQADLAAVRAQGYAITDSSWSRGWWRWPHPSAATLARWSPRCRCPAPPPGSPRPHCRGLRPSAWRRAGELSCRARPPAEEPRQPPLERPPGGTSTRPASEGRCRVTTEELLRQLYDETLVGNGPAVLELTNEGLARGLGPETLLYEALIPSLEEVGARFERGDFFVPEMLIAGKAMAGALEILRPLLAETGAASIGTIVMGTVKGDVHDIGKNLVNIMFEGAGFHVIDLGVQVAPEKFVDAVREHQPDIVGFSAFLTTTMPMFKANINALQKSGLRDQVIVMVGGAPVTQEYADVVGADGYAPTRPAAVVRAKELLQRRRAALPA